METSQMEMQHVNVKLLVRNPEDVDLEPLIPVFHGWIQSQRGEGLLLDIADYRHVDAGPGVVLIGHEGNYSVDNTDNRLGVRYNRKAALDGSNQDRLKQAARAALQPKVEKSRGKLRLNVKKKSYYTSRRNPRGKLRLCKKETTRPLEAGPEFQHDPPGIRVRFREVF